MGVVISWMGVGLPSCTPHRDPPSWARPLLAPSPIPGSLTTPITTPLTSETRRIGGVATTHHLTKDRTGTVPHPLLHKEGTRGTTIPLTTPTPPPLTRPQRITGSSCLAASPWGRTTPTTNTSAGTPNITIAHHMTPCPHLWRPHPFIPRGEEGCCHQTEAFGCLCRPLKGQGCIEGITSHLQAMGVTVVGSTDRTTSH